MITRQMLLEKRPSGVLQAMIDGLLLHNNLPSCTIEILTYGKIYPNMKEGTTSYQLCAATATICSILGTTFPDLVETIIKDNKLPYPSLPFMLVDIAVRTEWFDLYSDFQYCLESVRCGNVLSLLSFYQVTLGDVIPGIGLMQSEDFPKFFLRTDDWKTSIPKLQSSVEILKAYNC